MTGWVRVEFYGAIPDRPWDPEALDLLEIARQLGEAFGFEAIDGLVVNQQPKEESR